MRTVLLQTLPAHTLVRLMPHLLAPPMAWLQLMGLRSILSQNSRYPLTGCHRMSQKQGSLQRSLCLTANPVMVRRMLHHHSLLQCSRLKLRQSLLRSLRHIKFLPSKSSLLPSTC